MVSLRSVSSNTPGRQVLFIAQEILIDRASYPTAKICENSHKFRPLGLGYTNLGGLIMSLGYPYDSDEARGLCSVITASMTGFAYITSTFLAACKGSFTTFEANKEAMLNVMSAHQSALDEINSCDDDILESEA